MPVILTFLSRSGAHIDSVDFIGLDKAGATTDDPKPATHGVKIAFTRPGSTTPQNVYYFEANIADEVLKKNDAVLKFCDTLGRSHSLLKAASYLMHGHNFDIVKNYILSHSDLIVQDDSGIPYRAFEQDEVAAQFLRPVRRPDRPLQKGKQRPARPRRRLAPVPARPARLLLRLPVAPQNQRTDGSAAKVRALDVNHSRRSLPQGCR